MTPAPHQAGPKDPLPPSFPGWTRHHIPAHFDEIDKGQVFLQNNKHMVLEMHENGTQAVNAFTEFAVLIIYVYKMTALMRKENEQMHENGQHISRHIIRGYKNGHFLCMDDRSVLYSSKDFIETHCQFIHKMERSYDTYYREVNRTKDGQIEHVKWYVGFNKKGVPMCGNSTSKYDSGAQFNNIARTSVPKIEDSESPLKVEEPCCATKEKQKKCNRPHRKKDKERKTRNWCKKTRRKFFSLELRDLKKYYEWCIQNLNKNSKSSKDDGSESIEKDKKRRRRKHRNNGKRRVRHPNKKSRHRKRGNRDRRKERKQRDEQEQIRRRRKRSRSRCS